MNHVSVRLRLTTILALLSFCTLTMAATGAMAQPPAPHKVPHSLNAYVQGKDAAGNTASGLISITHFDIQGNQLVAQGVFNGTVTTVADGTATPIVNEPVTLPVISADPSCSLVNLVLGPLHLNVLGLVIDLNQVVLNITAVPGAGNLLGNLLCAVANLLNGGGPLANLLTQLQTLLNQILAAL
ncbi:MAG: hypothetical protein ACJ713_19020 [Candidatus Sulfotelmatobacter sp.]